MDMSPKFEAGVRALLVPTVRNQVPYSHQLWEPSYDEMSRVYRGKNRPHTLSQHVHRIVSRMFEANDLGTLRGDQCTPAPPRSVLQSGFRFGNGKSEDVVPYLWDPDSTGRGAAYGSGKEEWDLLSRYQR